MQALTLTQTKSPLELTDWPELIPGRSEVIVRVKAASLNRRDYWITQGLYPGIDPPVVLGSDAAGIVIRCGAEVDPALMGREVVINPGFDWGASPEFQSADFHILGSPRDGTFAEEVAAPVSQLVDKPAELSWIQAAALPLAGVTAYRAVFTQGLLAAGETMLITGIGGGVASFALQFGVAAGAKVFVTSSSEDKIERAISLGAAGGFNYREANWWKELAQQASPDLIIDSAGGSGYGALLNVAASGGRVVNYGATAGAPEKLDMFKLFWKQLRLIGSTMGSPADFQSMIDFVTAHQIQPVIDGTHPLAAGDEAIALMGSSPQFGKVVLTIDD